MCGGLQGYRDSWSIPGLQVKSLALARPSGLALLPLHFEEEIECVRTIGGGGAVTWEGGAWAGELPGLLTPNHWSSSSHSGDTEAWGESRLGMRPTVRIGGGQIPAREGDLGRPFELTWGEALGELMEEGRARVLGGGWGSGAQAGC